MQLFLVMLVGQDDGSLLALRAEKMRSFLCAANEYGTNLMDRRVPRLRLFLPMDSQAKYACPVPTRSSYEKTVALPSGYGHQAHVVMSIQTQLDPSSQAGSGPYSSAPVPEAEADVGQCGNDHLTPQDGCFAVVVPKPL